METNSGFACGLIGTISSVHIRRWAGILQLLGYREWEQRVDTLHLGVAQYVGRPAGEWLYFWPQYNIGSADNL